MSLLEITDPRDDKAKVVADVWTRLNSERMEWLNQGLDARRYVTATSTNQTEVGKLPWKNKTTIPKLTQIADNLQSYYMAALMPMDDWFRFEGADIESHEKAELIENYMATKLRMGDFRKSLEQRIRDWILYGNCFAGVTWAKETARSMRGDKEVVTFMGPKIYRISPLDCVIDKRAASFDESPFIRRRFVSIGDLLEHNSKEPNIPYDEATIQKVIELRKGIHTDWVDFYRDEGYLIDGFNSFDDYLDSQYIELLEYWGDIYIHSTGEYRKNAVITIADRSFTLAETDNPTWHGKKPFAHAGWRILPDNLYGQSPLANLVGMQYRCDHLENLKADTFDQIVHPITKVKGDEVEDFKWGPGEKIYCGAEGDVEVLRPDWGVLNADSQIAFYHNMMEMMAGSPREAAGFRTPGEKTAFEVNVLQQGADRMFYNYLNRFESHMIERVLLFAFEAAIRNLDEADVARTFNDNTRALELMTITQDDVVADGVFRAVGAKHFAARNKRIQEVQNFLQISATPGIAPHISGVRAAKALEEELGFEKYNLVEENVAIKEQMQTQAIAATLQQSMQQGGISGPADAELQSQV